MPKRRIRVKPIPEGTATEKARCLRCSEVFEIQRQRQFAMCPRCGEIMARESIAGRGPDVRRRAA